MNRPSRFDCPVQENLPHLSIDSVMDGVGLLLPTAPFRVIHLLHSNNIVLLFFLLLFLFCLALSLIFLSSFLILAIVCYIDRCSVVLFHPRKNRQTHIVNPSRKTLTAVAFSADGKYLVTGECGHQPSVRIWDLADRSQVAEFAGHKFGVVCAVRPASFIIHSIILKNRERLDSAFDFDSFGSSMRDDQTESSASSSSPPTNLIIAIPHRSSHNNNNTTPPVVISQPMPLFRFLFLVFSSSKIPMSNLFFSRKGGRCQQPVVSFFSFCVSFFFPIISLWRIDGFPKATKFLRDEL